MIQSKAWLQQSIVKSSILIIAILLHSNSFAQSPSTNRTQTDLDTITRAFSKPLEGKLVNPKVLNAFFGKQVSQYLSKSGDLSLNSAYSTIDNSDGRLLIGYTRANSNRTDKKITWVLNAGVKADIKSGFATIVNSKGSFQNNIGASLKFTYIGKGIIYRNPRAEAQEKRREKFESETTKLDTLRAKLHASLKFELNEEIRMNESRLSSYGEKPMLDVAAERQKYINALYKTYLIKLANDEAELLVKQQLYKASRTWWFSLEGYIPFTKSQYQFTPDFASPFAKENYLPFEGRASLSYLWTTPGFGKKHKQMSILLQPYLAGNLNDVVKTEEVKSRSFEQYINQGGMDTVSLARIKSEDVYVGEFRSFPTFRAGAELTWFVLPFIGVSGGIEQYFGDDSFEGVNWKLGIPVSLKDKDKKPKVNFELQWKETQGAHLVGINVGIPLTKPVYE